jgi:metal-responsive CopG/Arc/MetJ family transcriptional regulator
VELFMLQGRAPRIREFADRLRNYRDARLVEIVFTDLAEATEKELEKA